MTSSAGTTEPADPSRRGDLPDDVDAALLVRVAARAVRSYAGWLFVAAGALLVLLGYLGVSREAIVAKQLPYLVSGGVGGVLLCIVGAYFLGTEELRRDAERLERLERQVGELHAALLSRPDAPHATDLSANGREGVPAASTVGAGRLNRLVTVEGGGTYHRAGCALVDGKVTARVTGAEVAARGLPRCPVCEPPAVTSTPHPAPQER